MRWIAGIDGGGSKTAVLLRTVDGKETRTCRVGSIDPAEYGVEGYADGLLAALTQLGVTAERVAAVCIGIPCFGEYPELDAAVSARTRQLFPNGAVRCENDCYVGFAGAFGLKAGINVVAGTGAIAYGEDEEGHAARSGGWHHDFSDEGSGVWLGRESFALFARQMDGRAPRTAFYEIFREGLGLRRDTDVIDYYARRCAGNRAELAKTQELLLAAAQAGDNSAAALYRKAPATCVRRQRRCTGSCAFRSRYTSPIPAAYFRSGTFYCSPSFGRCGRRSPAAWRTLRCIRRRRVRRWPRPGCWKRRRKRGWAYTIRRLPAARQGVALPRRIFFADCGTYRYRL